MKSSVLWETAGTIEFELTADELVRAGDSLHANQQVFAQTSASPLDAGRKLCAARALHLRTREIAFAVGGAFAVLLVGIAGYRTPKPAEPAHARTAAITRATAAPQIVSTSASKPAPLRLANPFDATEIFEFPPGTSLEYARETVAEFLLGRARDRHVRHEQRSRNRRELRSS